MILEAEADLVPMGSRSPLRFGRRRADIPRMSCAPSSAWLRSLRGRRPWFKVSTPARSARGMRSPPDLTRPIFRMASVVAWQAPMGPRSPLRFGRCRTDVPRTSCNPSSALKWGKLNYTDFAQNCILDQKERTSL